MGTEKTYLVLTPKKIEDIFRDLIDKIDNSPFKDFDDILEILESKKQELLKSIK